MATNLLWLRHNTYRKNPSVVSAFFSGERGWREVRGTGLWSHGTGFTDSWSGPTPQDALNPLVVRRLYGMEEAHRRIGPEWIISLQFGLTSFSDSLPPPQRLSHEG